MKRIGEKAWNAAGAYRMGISKIGYVIPEFPSQTHSWMWREIVQMRHWGVELKIFSTRRPDTATRARHAFADDAQRETFYLWPTSPLRMLASVGWAMLVHPMGFLRAMALGCTLPVDKRPAVRTVLPLLVPACLLARQCRRNGITHLHSQTLSNSAILCMMVKRLIGIPFSLSLNADINWWGGAMKEKFTDAAFTNSHTVWLLEQMRRDFPSLKPDQTLLARIGVDTGRWHPLSARSASHDKQHKVLTVGRLAASKGHDDLLRAVRLLVDGGLDVSLSIAGSGSEREPLENLTGDLALTDRVTFLGSVSEDQIIDELRSAHLFMLASHAEALGVVYMESMAMGVATIGTDVGGAAEVITHEVDGLLVMPHNPAALAEAARSVLTDDAYRMRLASAGREKVVRQFDSRIGAERLYTRLFGHAPPVNTDQ